MLPNLTRSFPEDPAPDRRYWQAVVVLSVLLVIAAAFNGVARRQLEAVGAELENARLDLVSTMDELEDSLDREAELAGRLDRADNLIADLFGYDKTSFRIDHTLSVPVKITAYTLSPDETDSDPLEAAFGRSRIAMIALSPKLEVVAGAKRGERFAIISDDGTVRTVQVFWDRTSQDNDGLQVDIIAPAKEVARWHGVRHGRLVKVVPAGKGAA